MSKISWWSFHAPTVTCDDSKTNLKLTFSLAPGWHASPPTAKQYRYRLLYYSRWSTYIQMFLSQCCLKLLQFHHKLLKRKKIQSCIDYDYRLSCVTMHACLYTLVYYTFLCSSSFSTAVSVCSCLRRADSNSASLASYSCGRKRKSIRPFHESCSYTVYNVPSFLPVKPESPEAWLHSPAREACELVWFVLLKPL